MTCCAVISLCGQRQEIGKALKLVADMRGRGIRPNIHTYTALINTCIRSGDYTLALDVFNTLKVPAPSALTKICIRSGDSTVA